MRTKNPIVRNAKKQKLEKRKLIQGHLISVNQFDLESLKYVYNNTVQQVSQIVLHFVYIYIEVCSKKLIICEI